MVTIDVFLMLIVGLAGFVVGRLEERRQVMRRMDRGLYARGCSRHLEFSDDMPDLSALGDGNGIPTPTLPMPVASLDALRSIATPAPRSTQEIPSAAPVGVGE